jgi:hypothetical protein
VCGKCGDAQRARNGGDKTLFGFLLLISSNKLLFPQNKQQKKTS